MKRIIPYAVLIIINFHLIACPTEQSYLVDSVFVSNLMALQAVVTQSEYDTFSQPINSVVLVRNNELICFLKVVQYLSGIEYWVGWGGTGIRKGQLNEICKWYFHNRSSLTIEMINKAYKSVMSEQTSFPIDIGD